MGEPAELSEAERAALFEYAQRVIDAVRNDEDQPPPRHLDGDAMDESTMIFKLAQLALEERNTRIGLSLEVAAMKAGV